MGDKGATWAADLLKLYFLGTAIVNVADNSASPFTSHVVALHTADPGAGGSQLTNEAAYTGYARVSVPRNGSGWTVTGTVASPAADIEFSKCTGSPGPNITYFSVSRGGGVIDYRGALVTPIIMDVLVKPVITTLSTITEA